MYYTNIVSDLKTSHDQLKTEEVNVENISHLSDIEQVELIADRFLKSATNMTQSTLRKLFLNQKMKNQFHCLKPMKSMNI